MKTNVIYNYNKETGKIEEVLVESGVRIELVPTNEIKKKKRTRPTNEVFDPIAYIASLKNNNK